MAKTVGSIMGIHTGKGRYLTPENFSNELYLGDLLNVLGDLLNVILYGSRHMHLVVICTFSHILYCM